MGILVSPTIQAQREGEEGLPGMKKSPAKARVCVCVGGVFTHEHGIWWRWMGRERKEMQEKRSESPPWTACQPGS